MYVIGTAGHVDHGKSALVRALTGIDPDRLREERERGMTIELGFAWLELPSGREVSIVDVPGHERFVRHMLAGVGAIDLALFVVAADEGVMPQTREHLEILDLLGVRHGVIALTKCDLVDEEWRALVEEDVRELLAPTSLAGAPLVPVSAVTREGLPALLDTLDRGLDAVPAPRDIGRPRHGIDRVFTMPGFGTVVTGTLLDGSLRVGDSVEAVPGGPTARIRGLQSHRREVTEATPGTRVAVNLAGVATEELARGQVLAPPGQLPPVRAFDARVRALEQRALPHNLRVTVHCGAAETQGRLRVLGAEEIPLGGEGWCQVILAPPIAAARDDLFVLRVSDATVGGGRIIDVNPPRHRRHDPATIARLEARAAGTPESLVLAALEGRELSPAGALEAAVPLPRVVVDEALDQLVKEASVVALAAGEERLYISIAGLRQFTEVARRALDAYHREHPLRFTMPREELRGRLGLAPREFNAVLPALGPEVERRGEGVARAGREPRLTAAQRRQAEATVATLVATGIAPPRLDLDTELLAYLAGSGQVVDCGDGVVLAAAAFEDAQQAIEHYVRESGPVTLAAARDALGTNRRAAQAILEALDRRGVTRREGEARVLVEATRELAAP